MLVLRKSLDAVVVNVPSFKARLHYEHGSTSRVAFSTHAMMAMEIHGFLVGIASCLVVGMNPALAGGTPSHALSAPTPHGSNVVTADTSDVSPNGIAVGGLVSDETFSVVGARFSRAFHDQWSPPEEVANANYTLRIRENPVPRFGAQLLVDIEGTTLYQGYLRPNRQQIEQAARTAVKRATLYLREYYEPREVY